MKKKLSSFLNTIHSITNPQVFWYSNLLLFSIIVFTVWDGGRFSKGSGIVKNIFLNNFGWLFIFSILWLIYYIFLILYKFGDVKLGKKTDQPEFSLLSWISMLFSAGLGIGLLYSGVYEPMFHYFNAPQISNFPDNERFLHALKITYFHWGAPAWLIYSSTGLIFAFVTFNQERPMIFSELIPKKLSYLKNSLDVFAVFSILIGIIIAFTLGVAQINAGLQKVFPALPVNKNIQVIIILLITVLATISVFSGLKKGIKYLSQINIYIALSLFILIIATLPLAKLMGANIQAVGLHISDFFKNLTYTAAFEDKTWIQNWTILYWAWWASWTPFVGLFIARISKGRTVREYILCTILIPSMICLIWFTVFGYAGYELHQSGSVDMEPLVQVAPQNSLFTVLNFGAFPLVGSILAVISILIFYVTSSDSSSFVVDMITSGGKLAPHKYLKIYWSIMEGALAAVLLFFGGALLIKNLVILFTGPILLYICYGTHKVFWMMNSIVKESEKKYLK